MPILTLISGIPLYTTPQEAISWATANGLSGYHTHMFNGQVGYMGGFTHNQSVGATPPQPTPPQPTPPPPPPPTPPTPPTPQPTPPPQASPPPPQNNPGGGMGGGGGGY